MSKTSFVGFLTTFVLFGFGLSAIAEEMRPYVMTVHSIPSEGVLLEARYYKPVSTRGKHSLIVMVSGSGAGDTTADPYTMMHVHPWTRAGFAVVAYNKRGSGKSGGVPSETDFQQRATDLLNVLKYCRQLPDVDSTRIGLWGISQAGWVIPKSVACDPAIAFAILVSPAGVNPARQVEFYMENEFRKVGLKQDEMREASQLNRAVMKYYGSGDGYEQAQMLVSQAHGKDWFEKVRKHPFWHEMHSEDRIFTPVQLAEAIQSRRKDFSWYTAPSTFADYSSDYSRMKIPLLIVHGGRDELVPVQEAISVFKKALVGHAKSVVTFRTFDRGDHSMQISPKELVPGYIEEITAWISAVSYPIAQAELNFPLRTPRPLR